MKISMIADDLCQRFDRHEGRLCVVGLGYVGLPLAIRAVQAGYSVEGVDTNGAVVSGLLSGVSHVDDVTDSELRQVLATGRFTAATATDHSASFDAIVLAVPTPLTKTKDPDVSYIRAAVKTILPNVTSGTLVVLESTSYPGTTEELLVKPFLELGFSQEDLGESLFVAFSPERIDPGNPTYGFENTPKVVGGVTPSCTLVATHFYASLVSKVHPVASVREAEMVKLLENTFRAVNIALVNEMLLMCNRLGIDIWNVISAAATKPFGFMPFYPGPGIGGHCIPLDPSYLSWKARSVDFYNRFIELATDINGNMPRFVLQRIYEILNSQGKALSKSAILLVGMAYKPNVSDTRESPGVELMKLLEDAGAMVCYHDPHVKKILRKNLIYCSEPLTKCGEYDLVVLVTDHDDLSYDLLLKRSKWLLDCRNALGRRYPVAPANVTKL